MCPVQREQWEMDKTQRLNKIPEIIQIYAEEKLREWELFLIWNKHIFSTLYSMAIIPKKKKSFKMKFLKTDHRDKITC